jgi:hypothetical protein
MLVDITCDFLPSEVITVSKSAKKESTSSFLGLTSTDEMF